MDPMTRAWPLRRCLYAVLLLFGLVVLSGCVRRGPHRQAQRPECHPGKEGPPPHAPAHGYRAKCQYRYYPGPQVYYSPRAEVWFWLEGKHWEFGPRLPGPLSVSAEHSVTVELQTPYPYLKHEEVKKKYAPEGEGGDDSDERGRGRGGGEDPGKDRDKDRENDGDNGKGENEDKGGDNGKGKVKDKGKGKDKDKGKGPPAHAR